MQQQPNIILLLPDQFGGVWLNSEASQQIPETPHLQTMVSSSVYFTRAYTNIPLCTPYRACLLSGKYPSQTGIMKNGMRIPQCTTLAQRLDRAGYVTSYIGKWHLSGDPQGNRWVPPDARGGFQRFVGWESHHIDHYQGLAWRDDPDRAIALRGHETDGLTDLVEEELAYLKQESAPFFLTVAWQAPHPPCSPPQAFLPECSDEDILSHPPTTGSNAWYRKPQWNADYSVAEFRRRYFGEMTHLDSAVGRVFDQLENNGMLENTVVIFTSDHGEMAGCHGLFGKGVMYEEAIRVPLIIHFPEAMTIPSSRCERPVCTLDLFATILELAGIEPPNDCDGQSLLALCRNSSSSAFEDKPVIVEYADQICAVSGQKKYIFHRQSGQLEAMYDLEEDPYETRNIAGSSSPLPDGGLDLTNLFARLA